MHLCRACHAHSPNGLPVKHTQCVIKQIKTTCLVAICCDRLHIPISRHADPDMPAVSGIKKRKTKPDSFYRAASFTGVLITYLLYIHPHAVALRHVLGLLICRYADEDWQSLQVSSSDQKTASRACSREATMAMVGRWEGCRLRQACMRLASSAGQVAGDGMSTGSCSLRWMICCSDRPAYGVCMQAHLSTCQHMHARTHACTGDALTCAHKNIQPQDDALS